jgi:predicted RNase H-like HicB family nuclease
MRYKVVLSKNEDGYTVHCPGLRGCWSQGATEQEALENIRSAIEEYLDAVSELAAGEEIREVEVPVG